MAPTRYLRGVSIPLLVTRDEESTTRTCATLRAQGIDAIAAPCLEFRVVDPDPVAVAAWADTPLDLLVTSPRSLPALQAAGPSPRWRVLALAPTTAAALRRGGFPVAVACSGGGAALAAVTRPGPVLLATSDIGGDEVLRVRPDTMRWVTYQTVCPADLPAAARAALLGAYEVLAASPSALRNLEALAPGAVARARCIRAWGGTTRAAALALGATRVEDAPLVDEPPRQP